MDFIYKLLKAGLTKADSDTGADVATKINENFKNVANKFTELEQTIGNGGTSNYNQLTNVPIKNESGKPVVINKLASGIYTITGAWTITADGIPRTVPEGSLFYVSNSANGCKVTVISAEGIFTYTASVGAGPDDIIEDQVVNKSDLEDSNGNIDLDDLIGAFSDSGSSTEFDSWIGVF